MRFNAFTFILYIHQGCYVFIGTQKLLKWFSQNSMERWHMSHGRNH